MAEAAVVTSGSKPPRRLRRDWKWRLLNELFAAFVALLFLLAGTLVLLDTAPGHRFIVDRIDRLDIGPQVGGQPRSGSLHGKADVHSGRALIELAAVLNNGGDRFAFGLDAEPDRNKFDVVARVVSPGNGLVPAIIGTKRAIKL